MCDNMKRDNGRNEEDSNRARINDNKQEHAPFLPLGEWREWKLQRVHNRQKSKHLRCVVMESAVGVESEMHPQRTQ